MPLNVSVIIPCKNEEVYIEKCISSILQCNYPNEHLTIYVCDGKSIDNSRNIVKKIVSKNSNVFLLDNDKETTPFGLNLGLKTSTADIKIILGAHAEIDKDFINENIRVFEESDKIGCAGGYIENVFESDDAEIIGMAMSSPFGVGNAHFRTQQKSGFVDTVAFGAYKKEVFEKVGYFDESLTRNQDDEFNYRVTNSGYKIYLSNKIKSKYYVRSSFKKLAKQYYQYGYWKVFVNKKHKTITTIRQLIPLFLVLYLLFGSVISFVHPILLYLFILGCLAYIFAAIGFSISLTSNLTKATKLTYCFFTLHLSYGLGYLFGIFDFAIFNKKPSKKTEELTR